MCSGIRCVREVDVGIVSDLIDSKWIVTPAQLYPQDWAPDYLPRQFLTLYVVTLLGGYTLYLSFACFSYYFLFDHDLRKHPKFLVDQERKELGVACRSLPWMTLLTVPLFVLEVRGHSQLYGNLDAATTFGVNDHPGGWRYVATSVLCFLFFNDCLISWKSTLHPADNRDIELV